MSDISTGIIQFWCTRRCYDNDFMGFWIILIRVFTSHFIKYFLETLLWFVLVSSFVLSVDLISYQTGYCIPLGNAFLNYWWRIKCDSETCEKKHKTFFMRNVSKNIHVYKNLAILFRLRRIKNIVRRWDPEIYLSNTVEWQLIFYLSHTICISQIVRLLLFPDVSFGTGLVDGIQSGIMLCCFMCRAHGPINVFGQSPMYE